MTIPAIFQHQRLPVIAAPMFLVSGPELVIATLKSGVAGTFPALNQRTTEGFEQWVVQVSEALAAHRAQNPEAPHAPYGVNLIVHRSNPRLHADLEVCVRHRVPFIITSLGAVSDLVNAVHSYGGLVFHDITTRRHAEKAVEAGVDGLILVTGGAGGHAGTTNPFALMAEIRSFYKGTILLAGALSTGRDVAAARVMGADFAYMGTRFIATAEANAQPEYKEMLLATSAGDIVHTPAVSGVPANFMRPSLEQNGYNMEKLLNPAHVNLGEELTVNEEAKAWKTVWSAGHGVSAIHDVPTTAELVSRLEAEYREALQQAATW
jgi:nitronate monooxygenase